MRLAADFPSTTRDDWRALALGVLRRSGVDADPEAALATDTYDGVRLAPLYDAGDLPELRGPRPAHRGWDVRQRHAVPDNEAVLADLENGVTSLWLALAPRDLERTLRGVHLDLAPVVLEAGERTAEAAAVLLSLGAGVRGNLGAGLGDHAVALARRCAAEHEAEGHPVSDGRASTTTRCGADAQELGCHHYVAVVGGRHLAGADRAGCRTGSRRARGTHADGVRYAWSAADLSSRHIAISCARRGCCGRAVARRSLGRDG
ncbi:hypothetical protein [Nonomuraea dietziae]|uniref:hypothetical protein n=1 Tax=Nonomuraea dietziae TaxID=65515 RepID=UPI0031D99521